MRVHYLGPALPEFLPQSIELDANLLSPMRYLVEVHDEAGVEGDVIEGDLLVVDESRPIQHDDLVIVQSEDALRVFRCHRMGGRLLLIPTVRPSESVFAYRSDCRGVVIHRARVGAVSPAG
ncbi:hypothetical protein KUV86_16975 [Halomonas sp. DP8Y7-3]|uniref:S24 family peptidase n=1 Tax=Halomonas sp. DP8Y7-3 TaxID=2859079 RepID=UPI001C984DC4|nr:S24 family peptidase [Halomonas sp. DP8Y7-3]MBY5930802.1 hypothetical protein [Halomonas sp. DP8Y7-3]